MYRRYEPPRRTEQCESEQKSSRGTGVRSAQPPPPPRQNNAAQSAGSSGRSGSPAAKQGAHGGGQNGGAPKNNGTPRSKPQRGNPCHSAQKERSEKEPPRSEKTGSANTARLISKFIPPSVYNPETGKILGFLSAEDLLLAALILLLIDNDGGEDGEDNSMLILALVYILISDHIDLPI